jgi:hypothetical protein
VESLFTTSLHLSNFVQTQNEAKILTKSMLCIYTDISNKPDLVVNNLSASTSHAFDSELDSIVIKPVIVDTACLDNSENSCLNNCVKPKSKDIVLVVWPHSVFGQNHLSVKML